jgi:hypothetical protein
MHGSCGFPISSALNGSRMVMSSLDATPMASVSLSRPKCAAPRVGGSPSNGPNLTARRRRKSRANGDACSIRLDSILMASALGSPSAMATRPTRSGRRSESGCIALAFTRPVDLQTADTITRSDTHDSNVLRACLAVRVAGRGAAFLPNSRRAPLRTSCSQSIQENPPPLPIPRSRRECACVRDDGDVYGGRARSLG